MGPVPLPVEGTAPVPKFHAPPVGELYVTIELVQPEFCTKISGGPPGTAVIPLCATGAPPLSLKSTLSPVAPAPPAPPAPPSPPAPPAPPALFAPQP